MTAACAGHPEPLWDATIEGECEVERIVRQTRALAICRGCPERIACIARIDLKHDDGIRGGMFLPTIYDRDRRSVSSFQPGRGGFARVVLGACPRETLRGSRETSRTERLTGQDAAPSCANTRGLLTPPEPARTLELS